MWIRGDRQHRRVEAHRAEELAEDDLQSVSGEVSSSSIVPERFSSA